MKFRNLKNKRLNPDTIKTKYYVQPKTKSDSFGETSPSGGASLIAAGTTLKGDITSNGDIRIDGTLQGNIYCTAKVVIGANGVVEGDISGQQADIMGKVTGTIKVKEFCS